MVAALTEKGYDVNYTWGIGTHSNKQGGAILPDMLRWLWRDYVRPPDDARDSTNRMTLVPPGFAPAAQPAVGPPAPPREWSAAQLKRVSYHSAATGEERDYYVYLPEGFAQKDRWPVLMTLSGNGERGDGKGDLDYVLANGPLFEAWSQRRRLPFVIIAPQLPMFNQAGQGFITGRTRDRIRYRRARRPIPARPQLHRHGSNGRRAGGSAHALRPRRHAGGVEPDRKRAARDDRPHARRVQRRSHAGLSDRPQHRGFRHLVSGRQAPGAIRCDCARRGVLPSRPGRSPLRKRSCRCGSSRADGIRTSRCSISIRRSTCWKHRAIPKSASPIEADMGHNSWNRVYAGQDLYDWFLTHQRTDVK